MKRIRPLAVDLIANAILTDLSIVRGCLAALPPTSATAAVERAISNIEALADRGGDLERQRDELLAQSQNQSGVLNYGIAEDFPELWEIAKQHDFTERLGGSTDPLSSEVDAALRELLGARREAESSHASGQSRGELVSAIPREDWEWFGSPAHLIVALDCRFHLATLVGPWVVSTVGEWLPDSSSWHIYAESKGVVIEGRGDARRADFLNKVGFIEIGAGRKYETFVFLATGERCTSEECNCGMPEWTGSELDTEGYNERGDAQRGHYAMCEKWAAEAENGQSRPNA